jgi:hypothetical protein
MHSQLKLVHSFKHKHIYFSRFNNILPSVFKYPTHPFISSFLHIVTFYLIYIFMLVLAIDIVYTYFNSIDLNNRQKFLTHIQRIR